MQLSIIIVDYKTHERALALTRSLASTKAEIIIIDNTMINRGYGGGINAGVSQAKGDVLLFLNPDVEISVEGIHALVAYLEAHPDVAVVGPQFVDANGVLVPSSLGRLRRHRAWIDLSILNRIFPGDANGWWLRMWDRKSTQDVQAINGACMLVRRSDFEAIGGFDESYFLYWEENDFCQRCIDHGRRVVFFSDVRAMHTQELSMRQSDKNLEFQFMESETFFLRRHLGVVAGTLTTMWLWCAQEWRALVLVMITLVVRLRSLSTIPMIDDVRRDYGQAVLMIQGKGIPLLGIPSSVPRFSQGPFNIWFDALAFKIGGVSFVSPVIAASIVAAITSILIYALLKRNVHKNIAWAAALLFVLSPAAIAQSRLPFYLFAIPLFVVVFLIALQRLTSKKGSSVFWAFLSFCFLFQWELATIPFIAVLAVGLYRNRIRVLRYWKQIIGACLIGLFPQILFDLTHRCVQLCHFVAWMGYRTVAVTGVDGRHGLTLFTGEFWASVFTHMQQLIGFGVVGPLAVFFILIAGGLNRLRLKSFPSVYVYAWVSFLCLCLGLVIHGVPSEAYFPPFLALLPILVAYSLSSFL